MTREQIARKIEDLALQLEQLGTACTRQHFEEDDMEYRALLYLVGQFCQHSGFQLESFDIYIKPRNANE